MQHYQVIDIVSQLFYAKDPTNQYDYEKPQQSKQPEYELLRDILTDAIDILRNPLQSAMGMKAYDETLTWFQSDETEYVFSYIRICETLGLDPKAVWNAVSKLIAPPPELTETQRTRYENWKRIEKDKHRWVD